MAATEDPELNIALEKVCFVIVKAREFEAKDVITDEDSGSNAVDDGMLDVLEDHGDDPVQQELTAFIDALNDDEQIDLVALMWLGRDDGTLGDWPQVRSDASDAHNENTAGYLLGTPLVADYLASGLDTFGLSCSEDGAMRA